MADTDVWALGAISTPAATDRVPIASGSLAGGYSLRGDFVWKQANGKYYAAAAVGIGTNDAAGLLEIAGVSGDASAVLTETGVRQFALRAGGAGSGILDIADLTAGVSSRLAITAAGNVVVGGTASSFKFTVFGAQAAIQSATNADGNLRLINTGQDWCVGMLGSPGSTALSFYNNTAGSLRLALSTAGVLTPGADNSQNMGSASLRFATFFGGTGTINTSDAREKTATRGLSSAELAAAKRIAGEIGIFQFIGRIRDHVGVVAQDVWAIMADEGLIDPIVEGETPSCSYAFLCYDEWDDNEGSPAGNRFGIRPDQLAYFLIAAQEARIAALESP